MLWTRHRAVWFAGKSEVCVWSDMHASGLAAGRGRAGNFLGNQAAHSSRTTGSVTLRREWYHPLKAVGTVGLCLLAWQMEQVSLADVPARSRFGCIWSFCVPGWGLSQYWLRPLTQQSGRCCMVSVSCLCFHCCYVGLISCQGRNLLFWLSTPNFACAARHFELSLNLSSQAHTCMLVLMQQSLTGKNTWYKHIQTQSHMDTCLLIDIGPIYRISLLASKSWPMCQYLGHARLDHFHCLSLKSWKLFYSPQAFAPIFFEK